jgi:hypothetical protein
MSQLFFKGFLRKKTAENLPKPLIPASMIIYSTYIQNKLEVNDTTDTHMSASCP